MRAIQQWLLIFICGVTLVACAAPEPAHKLQPVDTRDLPRALGCASDEVAFCAGTDCRPEDYTCVNRERVLGSIWPGRNL